MGAVNTTKVRGRRALHFNSLDDIAADIDCVARSRDVQVLGNWSAGQVVQHLAVVMNKSIDGFTERPPAVVRFFLKILMKQRIISRPMSPGFKLPGRAEKELVAPPTPLEEAVQNLRQALGRLKAESHREPHPAFGPFT